MIAAKSLISPANGQMVPFAQRELPVGALIREDNRFEGVLKNALWCGERGLKSAPDKSRDSAVTLA
jgi:hypothetical protein